MNSDDPNEMTLNMPSTWDNFGQWLIYGIVAAIVIVVLIFMFKLLFPSNNKNDEDKD